MHSNSASTKYVLPLIALLSILVPHVHAQESVLYEATDFVGEQALSPWNGVDVNATPIQLQRLVIDSPTVVSQVDAFVRRLDEVHSIHNPWVVIYDDDGGDNPDPNNSLPKTELFRWELPVPAFEERNELAWATSTGWPDGGFTLQPGVYWIGVAARQLFEEGAFVGRIGHAGGNVQEEDGNATIARLESREIFSPDDPFFPIGIELQWQATQQPANLMIRVHGELVPEPNAFGLLYTGVGALGLFFHGRRRLFRHGTEGAVHRGV